MSHFGHRVIGRKKASEEAEAVATRSNHFGPRVIGDVLAKRRLKARQDDGAKDSRSTPGKKKAKKEAAKKAIDAFGNPELVKLLNSTGMGNHPEVIRAFYNMGKTMREDGPGPGGDNPPGKKTDAEIMYPNESQK